MLSVSTAGLIDFRSDKERIARKTAKGARAAKKQNRLVAEQTAAIERQTAAIQHTATQPHQPAPPQPTAPQGPPAGWYDHDTNPALQRW